MRIHKGQTARLFGEGFCLCELAAQLIDAPGTVIE